MKTRYQLEAHYEKQIVLATKQEMHWIKANDTLRALQSAKMKEHMLRKYQATQINQVELGLPKGSIVNVKG